MNKYVTMAVVFAVGVLWTVIVGALHDANQRPARIHEQKYRQTLSTFERDWLWACAQHRDLFDCDDDLATLKARK